MAAYKRLLVQTEVRSSTSGNCSQDIVSILGASASATTFCATTEVTSRRCAILQPEDHDYTDRIDYPESLSTFVCSVVPYIAGFVARKIATTNTSWGSLRLSAGGGGTRQPRGARGLAVSSHGPELRARAATNEPWAFGRRSQDQEKATAMIHPEMGSGAVGYYDRVHLRPERVPDIAVLKSVRPQPCEVPIIPDGVVYFGSGAAVIVVFLGLCVMAYMLIFTEGRSHDMDEPAARASRYNRQKKERSEIPCPAVITIYNKHMGGVDLLDSLISIYRPYLRSKRYYFRVFLHILDLTAVNAWLLYKRNALSKRDEYAERLLPLADFKMDLAASLCKAGKTVVKKRGRPSNESIEQASKEKRKRGPTAPASTKDVRLDQVLFLIYGALS
ncbi:hypothetical protein MRX96_024067 [Rhipicephalus microplus]